jgi:hypothetical protein
MNLQLRTTFATQKTNIDLNLISSVIIITNAKDIIRIANVRLQENKV